MQSEKQPRPNFFLIGAPKCGTTSLSEYLRTHPKVCFSDPKEPHYFNTDYPWLQRTFTERAYLDQAFAHRSPEHVAVGEGSVFYLLSRAAVPNILRFNPEAKILVMIRNPIDMVQSLHHQNVYAQIETEADFEQAWRRMAERREGRSIPRRCRVPTLLLYDEMGRLGEQLGRVAKLVPGERLKVIIFDDLIEDALGVYRNVLDFLGLEYDGRIMFPVANPSRIQADWYRRFFGGLPTGIDAAVRNFRRVFGMREFGIRRRLGELTTQLTMRRPLSAELHRELIGCFDAEIEKLSNLVGRDLSGWLRAPTASP